LSALKLFHRFIVPSFYRSMAAIASAWLGVASAWESTRMFKAPASLIGCLEVAKPEDPIEGCEL
jgi:hypothetical protein